MLPEGVRATILGALAPRANAAGAAPWPPLGPGARGGGRPASDSRLDRVRRRRLCARLRSVRRALRARGDRLCGRAGSSRRRSEGTSRALARAPARLCASRSGASSGAIPGSCRNFFCRPPIRRRSPSFSGAAAASTGTVGVAFTPALVVIAAQLAGALSWIALSAEDAPDFLTTAPLPRAVIERAKIAAIGQPIALILALPLAALAFASPWAGLCALLFGAGAIASAALINLWRQAPSRRGLVLRRHSQSKLVGMMEHLVSILWAVATTTAVIGSWATVVPLAAIAGVLALNRKWAAVARRRRVGGRPLSLPVKRDVCSRVRDAGPAGKGAFMARSSQGPLDGEFSFFSRSRSHIPRSRRSGSAGGFAERQSASRPRRSAGRCRRMATCLMAVAKFCRGALAGLALELVAASGVVLSRRGSGEKASG